MLVIFDGEPGLYCCLYPDCDHPRDMVFNGGSGYQEVEASDAN